MISKARTAKSNNNRFIVTPREICISCHRYSGPKTVIAELRDASGLLRENMLVTAQEARLAESNISYAETEVAKLDVEISRLQLSVEALQYHRSRLMEFKMRERALLSPVRRLPVEILQKIFIHAQELTGFDFEISFSRVATQVSTYWRLAAHSLPDLWTNIYVEQYYREETLKRGTLCSHIEKCLALSKEVPVTISLPRPCSINVLTDKCIRAIAENAHRWRNVTIANMELLQQIYSYIPKTSTFSSLTKFTICEVSSPMHLYSTPVLRHIEVFFPGFINNCQLTFGSAPSLTHVTLKGVNNPSTFFNNLPWAQITNFVSFRCTYKEGEFYDLIRSMPNLRNFSIVGYGNINTHHTPILLPSLEVLEVDDSEANMVHLIRAPSLKVLQAGYVPTCVLLDFVQRSGSALKKLVLMGTGLDDRWHTKEFQNLTELQLNLRGVRNFVSFGFHLLAAPNIDGGRGLFPQLDTLNVEGVTLSECGQGYFEAFLKVIRSRFMPLGNGPVAEPRGTNGVRSLKFVNLSFAYVEDWVLEELKDFFHSDEVRESKVQINVRDSSGKVILRN